MRIFLVILVVCSFLFSCERKRGRGHHSTKRKSERVERRRPATSSGQTVVKLTKRGGVYEVPIKINNHSMNFIFDTGASDISISTTEANFLYKNGALSADDIIGDVKFVDATGTISVGTEINLKEVEIGNRKLYNVSASVVNNIDAPLLLGQSALSKFGTITIDYTREQLIIK